MYALFISTTVISEPDNDDITCEGKGTAFSCVLNTTNVNIGSNNVQWYRLVSGKAEMINQDGANIFVTTNASGNDLNSTLRITNAIKSHSGYYWVGVSSYNVCNVSLTVGISKFIDLIIHNARISLL